MELSTLTFFSLVLCSITDVHAGARRKALAKRVGLMEEEIILLKRTTFTETKMIENFEELKSSLKEELTKTFVPPLIKRLVKQAIADIMKRDYIGNTICAHMVKEVQSLKATVESATTQLKNVTQELRHVQRERDTYRESLEEVHGELTKDIRALQLQLNETAADLRDARMLKSELNQTNADIFETKQKVTGLTENLMTLNMTCCWTKKEIKEEDVNESSLTTSSLSQVSLTTSTSTYPGSTAASTDPSPSRAVPPTPVATQDSDLHASTDPSPSSTVPPTPVTTQVSDLHATLSPAVRDLFSATWLGDLERVKRILSAGQVDINTRKGRWNWTPVMSAARWGHKALVELFVARGADVSLVDVEGDNVLHWASMGGDLEIVKLILSQSVLDINARDNNGRTAVYWARDFEHQQVVDLLVSLGAH
ncbi:uncharacterized protein LOC124280160 isoform X1 [Haliotis rubra]|uniref:uncharacterized protein LOC124280160 isoform X1 n=1 Tax=Haliotis rubra TaxID=36100 RepID=UPI001EE50FF2|nr:uncharacterized protein LOC124280160 isoform X1 [Haliotis rubra]